MSRCSGPVSSASRDPRRTRTAAPIREGLAVGAGLGAVLPLGSYDQKIQASNGINIGNNILDVAPSIALTYTTPPLLAEGTEVSTKIYLNNYRTNPETNYKTGSNINVDFAISEHIGRWQIGAAGYYLRQIADDRRSGVPLAPDGRQAEVLSLGRGRRLRHPRRACVDQVQGAELRVCLQHRDGDDVHPRLREEAVLASPIRSSPVCSAGALSELDVASPYLACSALSCSALTNGVEVAGPMPTISSTASVSLAPSQCTCLP